MYQVLVTPAMDYLLPRWGDRYLTGCSVEEHSTLQAAQCRAMEMEDLNWQRMIDIQIPESQRITRVLQLLIQQQKLMVEFRGRVLTPEQLKHRFFDRILLSQSQNEEFVLSGLVDVIDFRITNPWTKNLEFIAEQLISHPELRITRQYTEDKIINLVGESRISTPFRIQLLPTFLHQWRQWVDHQYGEWLEGPIQSDSQKLKKELLELQNQVDNSEMMLR